MTDSEPQGQRQTIREDPAVVAFIASQYRERYTRIWGSSSNLPMPVKQIFVRASSMLPLFTSIIVHSPGSPMQTKLRIKRTTDESRLQSVSTVVMGATECCIPLSESDLRANHRSWVGNDWSQNRHHGIIPISQSPLDIRLGWKSSPGAPVKSIGCYRLNLPALLSGGYVRQEGPGTIRLQFVHEGNGIYIRVREESPRLRVGYFGDENPV